MIDFEAAYEAEAQTVFATPFDELSAMNQVLIRRSADSIIHAALGDGPYYQPVYFDGRDTSNSAPSVNAVDWKGKRWGDWVRAWPIVES